jgi:hypothetical protein
MNVHAGSDENFLRRLRDELNSVELFDIAQKDAAIVSACEFARYGYNHYKNLSETFYMLDELIYPFHFQYNTRVSNPFREKIQDYVLRFMESGIADYFEWEYTRFLNQNVRSEVSFSTKETNLDFDDFFEIYKILLIGYLAGSVAFIFEWILYLMTRLWTKTHK